MKANLRRWLGAAVLAAGCAALAAAAELPEHLPAGAYVPHRFPAIRLPSAKASLRDAALRRARVWREPGVPIASVAFDRNPAAPWGTADEIACRFLPGTPHGTTSKFDCVLPNGDVIKVKYARTGEIPAEVAASRLLRAIGFGADDMYLMRRVRCFGCPSLPFETFKVLDWVALGDRYARRIDYDRYADFEWVAVERRFKAPALEVENGVTGWAFNELARIDPARGGSPRAHVDGLRVMAMLLNHWDNKADNQRLVCLGAWHERTGCAEPFALIHDAGSTFGPKKMNYAAWRRTPIWADASRCLLSMKRLPYEGATFADVAISEEGRRWIATKLTTLTDAQLSSLFSAARVPEHDGVSDRAADIARWVAAFKDKVHQIADRPPCPVR